MKGIEQMLEKLSQQFTEKNLGNGSSENNVQQGGRGREAERTSVEDGSNIRHRVDVSFGDEKWRKLEIPVFSSDDAYGWVLRVERYFQLKGVLEHEKLHVVMVAM
ncbi:hypothetical protein SESBI_25181 [Sesbania bispinosa]|nr:hypothetical protein SESBI_25181 [Sesbania bispinosa]